MHKIIILELRGFDEPIRGKNEYRGNNSLDLIIVIYKIIILVLYGLDLIKLTINY